MFLQLTIRVSTVDDMDRTTNWEITFWILVMRLYSSDLTEPNSANRKR